MNKERFAKLKAAYLPALTESIIKHPEDYFAGANAETIAEKMLSHVEKDGHIGNISIDSRSWRSVAKTLGIKHTRKAFNEYLAPVSNPLRDTPTFP